MLNQDWRAFHEKALVCNIHHDWPIELVQRIRRGERAVIENTYVPMLKAGGIDFDFCTIGGDHDHFCAFEDLFDGTLGMIDYLYEDLAESPSFVVAQSSQDILDAKAAGKHSTLLTIEGAKPIREDLWRLRTFYRLGVRSLCLTWFKANLVADGISEPRGGGLTDVGCQVIREMNRLGMIIDMSQCTPATFDDVMKLTEQPVIASHSNASGVCPHPRNLTDQQIEALAKNGSVMGINAFPRHLVPQNGALTDLLDHIDYVVKNFGEDVVTLGLNLTVAPKEAERLFADGKVEYTEKYARGIESLLDVPNITEGLFARGHSRKTIEKILSLNFLRVVRQVIDKV